MKKSKWKVYLYSFLGVIVIVMAVFGYEYYQLQPKQHFKSVPVVSTGQTNSNQTEPGKTEPSKTANAVNILIMGSDARPGQTIGHSDTMMLMHVDLDKNQINAVSIPRDTRVHLDGYGYTKLTSVQYVLQAKNGPKKGIEGAVTAISELTGVPINYYMETNFEGLQAMIDSVGGIEMNVPTTEQIGSQTINPGTHFFNGEMVLAITRERYSLSNGDYGRQQMQLEALKGIAKAVMKPSNITKLPSLVDSASKFMIGSNMSNSDMLSLGLALKNIDPNKQLHYQQLKGVGKMMYDDILKANNAEIVIDPQEMKQTIETYFQS